MGGLANALLAMQIAREAGIGLLGSGLTESSLGFAASAHLYGGFGTVPLADLNGPQFLDGDPITDPHPHRAGPRLHDRSARASA